MGAHDQSLLRPGCPPSIIGGTSASALRRAHAQRLLLFALSLLLATACGWEVMLSSWTMRAWPSRIFRDCPSILAVAICYGVAAGSRYLLSDVAAPTKALPGVMRTLAMMAVHSTAGLLIGFCTWDAIIARAGTELALKLKNGTEAVGGLVAGGVVCGGWFAVSFAWSRKRKDRLPFGIPKGTTLSAFLVTVLCSSLEKGLASGLVVAAGYVVLRLLKDWGIFYFLGPVLALLPGVPSDHRVPGVGEPGVMLVTYLVFLSVTVTWCLHAFLSSIMNAIITAPQDFLRLWDASEAAAAPSGARGGAAAMRPSCAAAMLLDALSAGHEVVLDMAERDFLHDRGSSGGDGYGYGGVGGGCTYKRGSMGDSNEEVELQRRALALTAMASGGVWTSGGGVLPGGSAGEAWSIVPTWAQVARVQALQFLALETPRNKDLRAALYTINIAQCLRTLCLEIDVTTLFLQSFAFREVGRDPAATAAAPPRALACDGLTDIQWLVTQQKRLVLVPGGGAVEAAAAGGAGGGGSSGGGAGRWLQTLKSGFTLPCQDTFLSVLSLLTKMTSRHARNADIGAGEGEGRAAAEAGGAMVVDGRWRLSDIRVQGAIWAAESMSALMVFAPGESGRCSLDPMIPVVLGSLTGALLAVEPLMEGVGTGSVEEDLEQLQTLAHSLQTCLSEVATKYRSCLSSFRFPLAYAKAINRVCPP